MALTLEQQIAAIMDGAAVETLQISAVRGEDGDVRFYTALHANGLCAFSDWMNLPTVREAIEGGIKSLNEKRLAAPAVGELAAMEVAA